jgi:hypothetical protein
LFLNWFGEQQAAHRRLQWRRAGVLHFNFTFAR